MVNAPNDAKYRVWWKLRKRSDNDPFDGTQIVKGVLEAHVLTGRLTAELGEKYNVGMFRVEDERPASTASTEG